MEVKAKAKEERKVERRKSRPTTTPTRRHNKSTWRYAGCIALSYGVHFYGGVLFLSKKTAQSQSQPIRFDSIRFDSIEFGWIEMTIELNTIHPIEYNIPYIGRYQQRWQQ